MKPAVMLALLIAACAERAPSNEANRAEPEPARAPPPAAAPFTLEDKNDLFEFDFAWPAEVSAIPQLAGRLRSEMEKAKAELVAGAEEDKAYRDKEGFPFNPFSSSTAYEAAGQSAQLLSLRVDAGGYTGGAHGSYGIGSLLWDRRQAREIAFVDLFAAAANRDRLLTQSWCDALNKAREEKRGAPVANDGLFDDCPALDDIAIIPRDSDRDGRFDRLLLAASPYVAGPWAEGPYEIELNVTPEIAAGMKAEYRPSFET